ncbi:MAG TPA: PmoA family protein [Verrucomicrobiota bacterium]|nr:PmoA family protein [Verrucomicrobiota bacterium]HNU49386.1 PmoA family protein [Verrucomicrobiota bacterium]
MRRGNQIVWQFQFDTNITTKPFFHPVALPGGAPLTWQSPPDHVWHYGLWFSWKYINRVNYWEQNRDGLCDGTTAWPRVRISPGTNFAATIALDLQYHPRTNSKPVLTEQRVITISPPAADGSYTMDWTLEFTAGDEAVTLDRTPPAGQPGGQAWGGYAGLSTRFAKDLADVRIAATGDTGEPHGHRYGFTATAADLNGRLGESDAGMAFLDHPGNPRHPSRWYAIDDPGVPFAYLNAAWLQLEPYALPAHGRLTLRYRVIVHPGRWTAERLAAEQRRYAEADSARQGI